MRTTVSLDDDAFSIAKQYAEVRSIGLGEAISDLVRRGAAHRFGTKTIDGFAVVDLPDDSPVVSMEHLNDLEDEI